MTTSYFNLFSPTGTYLDQQCADTAAEALGKSIAYGFLDYKEGDLVLVVPTEGANFQDTARLIRLEPSSGFNLVEVKS